MQKELTDKESIAINKLVRLLNDLPIEDWIDDRLKLEAADIQVQSTRRQIMAVLTDDKSNRLEKLNALSLILAWSLKTVKTFVYTSVPYEDLDEYDNFRDWLSKVEKQEAYIRKRSSTSYADFMVNGIYEG